MIRERLRVAVFRLAVRAYPRWIRVEYGPEMVRTFRDGLADRTEEGWRYTARAAWDASRGGLRERLRERPGAQRRSVMGGVGTMMGESWSDLRLAVRTLGRTPAFTLAAVVVLALGIGANTAIFSAVKTVLLAPAPFPDPGELVFTDLSDSSTVEAGPPRPTSWSYPKYRILAEAEGRLVDPLAGFARRNLTLTGAGDAVLLNVEVVTPDYLDVLRIVPVHGRDFSEADDAPGAAHTVLLAHDLWVERFGADPGAVGRTIMLEGRPVTVIGIAPPGFRGLTGSASAWVPVHTTADLTVRFLVTGAEAHWLRAIGRLPAEIPMQRLQERMREVGRTVVAAYPGEDPTRTSVVTADRMEEVRISDVARRGLTLLMLASGLLLVTACANLAGLLTARAASRDREISVRRALGASRWRVARTFLAESLVLGLLGGGAAVGVAWLGVRGLAAIWPYQFLYGTWNVGFTRPEAMTVDPVVLAYALGLAMLSGLAFGLAPALAQSRKDPASALGGRSPSDGRAAGRVRRGLVVLEVALALVLVVGAGLLARSLGELQRVDRGFEPGELLTFSAVPSRSSSLAEDFAGFNDRALDRLEALPEVEAAAVGCALPLGGHCWIGGVRVAGSRSWPVGDRPSVGINPVSDAFFETLGIPVLRGRGFTSEDGPGTPPVIVLSQSAADLLFPGEDPLGQAMEVSASVTPEGKPGARVVGIVGDVLFDDPAKGSMPEAYLAHRQENGSDSYVLRTRGDPLAALPAVRAAMGELAPELPLYGVQTLDDLETAATGDTRMLGGLVAAFALLALLLAATGVWAVVAYGVSRRTRELGLRMAMGARAGEVVRLVVREDLGTIVIGLAVGLPAAWLATRFLDSLLFEVSPADPLAFAGGTALLLLAGLAAAWLPARRATRLEPVEALRTE